MRPFKSFVLFQPSTLLKVTLTAGLLAASTAAHAVTLATFGSFAGTSAPGFSNGVITSPAGPVVAVSNPNYAAPFTGTTFVSYTAAAAAITTTTYTTSFTGNFAGDSGFISLLGDNSVTAMLNGFVLGTNPGFTNPATFSIASSDFVNGLNTFTFNVINAGDVTGFDFLATATTPEPSSLALLGTGALGLAGVLRRRFSR